MQRLRAVLSVYAVAILSAACSSGLQAPPGGAGALAPEAAVDRFLQLADESEYLQMGWYFGTAEGPVIQRDPPPDVENRMYALATVLHNNGYVLGTGLAVPGRVGAAQRFNVRLQREGRTLEVPITVVRGPDGRWLVEQVDVQAVTDQN